MELWFSVVLGLIQGSTEFIPVSSTGHLRVAPALFGQADPGAAYTAVIQLGTLAAVLVYFAGDLWRMVRGMVRAPRGPEAMQAWFIGLGTLPIVAAGLLAKKHIEGPLRSLWVVALNLIVVGCLMWWIDARAEKRAASVTARPAAVTSSGTPLLQVSLLQALVIGCAQACALLPGVSRSGATICAGLLVGLARPQAARFSFLLSIPAILGAGLVELPDALHAYGANLSAAVPSLVVGTLVAAVSGYAVMAWLMRWLSSRRLTVFAWYRVGAGLALVAALALGVLR